MRILVLFFSILYFSIPTFSQSTSLLKGKLVDETGRAILAANVYFKTAPQQGTVTNLEGQFTLQAPPSVDTLCISYIGYESLFIPMQPGEEQTVLHLVLKEASNALSTIFVKGKAPISEQYAVKKLGKLDIYINPSAQGDPLKAITTLPASTTDDESANPSLRGSSADRSRVILNGVPIYRPVRNSQLNGIGNFSIFNTELIKNQYVYASNPPLTYGNTSAGLIEIESIDELEESEWQVAATLASTGIMRSQKINAKAFLQLFSNYQFAGPFIRLNSNSLQRLLDFTSIDAGANFHWKPSTKITINSLTYAIREGYDYQLSLFTFDAPAQAKKERIFTVNTAKYFFKQGVVRFSSGSNFSVTDFTFGNLISNNHTKQFYNSLDVQFFGKGNTKFQGGISHDFQKNSYTSTAPIYFFAFAPEAPANTSYQQPTNHLLEAFIYGTWKIKKKWWFAAGLRTNIPIQKASSYWSAQLSSRYQINSYQSVLVSGGQYHNYTTPSFAFPNFQLLKSQQFALDYTFEKGKTKIQSALFWKRETGEQAIDVFLTIDQTQSYGWEFFLEQQLSPYLSLTVSNTFLEQTIHTGENRYPGRYDFNYFLKAGLQYMHYRWPTIALNYISRPGNYYTPIVEAQFHPETNFYQPYYSTNLFDTQYPSYNRLDLSLSKYFPYRGGSIVAFCNLANILNTDNPANLIFNRDYSEQGFEPYTKRTIYFGIVLKTEN